MRWSLIAIVAALGVIAGLINVFGLVPLNPWIISIFVWVISALILGGFASKKHFLHGFLAGVISSLIGSLLVYFFYDTYLANNPDIAEKLSRVPEGIDTKSFTLLFSPVSAAIAGVVLGVLSLLAGKIFGEKEKPQGAPPPQESNPPEP